MVEDCYGLLQVLELVERGVHIFGVSMGGMIAQQYCITHPDTVLSMTLHMTHAGIGDCIKPPLLTYLMFLKRPKSDSPRDVAESMADFVDTLSHGYRYEKDERGNILENEHNRQMREKVVSFFERISERDGAQNSLGLPRQAVAVMRAPKRLQRLRDVCGKYQIPVVVMHGGRDPLIPVSNGYQLAEAIPHAQLVVFPEVGHDFPEDLTRTFAEQTMLNMKTGELKKNSEKKK
ncbi:hypothetical protein AGDE_11632 [Angomonas deanei]|uniref:Serine aminopeptidase, S33/Alpha/beta hydrolase family/alpha/beta hydrolase fold/Dienelactone hydrolase family, putative n=1 Tax=Angomonas deanei TaxID=59799 RepID=A0A7G2CQG7_9TRYP|nr:hypothetical protein AGDE_11632 [Angomonas deanei]CAD2220422.1 Serine aminopeptidase, S33/Alpha/beta hydrolase family/alpha/beta hydrolase fold/Dienelactone hydrolase family, putative [Angomonas deanei]|eukprot:EPY25918.1 hypothetical protein AGDE_11632 [Angomonas deanei]